MVLVTKVEPVTYRLQSDRSTHWTISANKQNNNIVAMTEFHSILQKDIL